MSESVSHECDASRMKTSHALNLLAAFDEMRQSGVICDFEIQVGDQSLPVHRAVLAASSPYFRAMFTSGMKEVQQGFVRMIDEQFDAVRRCVDFMYSGETTVTLADVGSILHSSSLIQLDQLSERCFGFYKDNLSVENCLSARIVAQMHDKECLLSAAEQFISQNLRTVVASASFLQTCESGFRYCLSKFGCEASQQKAKWEAAINWFKYDTERRSLFPKIFEIISLDLLPLEFIHRTIRREPLVSEFYGCKDMLLDHYFAKIISIESHSKVETSSPADLENLEERHTCIACVDEKKHVLKIFNPENIQWSSLVEFPRIELESTRLAGLGCAIFAFQEKNPEILKIVGNEISSITTPTDRFYNDYFCVVLFQTSLFVVGENRMSSYDPILGNWQCYLPGCGLMQGFCTAASDGFMYAIGGFSPGNNAMRYCPTLKSWSEISKMKYRRYRSAAAVLNNTVFVMGGWLANVGMGCGDETISKVECFDSLVNAWVEAASLCVPRSNFSACVVDGKMYAVGGAETENAIGMHVVNSIEYYDEEAGDWKIVTKTHLRDGPTLSCSFSPL